MRLLIAIVGLMGCAHAKADPQQLIDADTEFAKAVQERGVEAWVEAFAPDGMMLPGGGPRVVGHAAIAEMMQRLGDPRKEKPALRIEWWPRLAGISDDGTLGYTIGNSVTHTGEGDRQGKYLTVWRKQPDGSWKAVVDLGNAGWAVP